MSVLQESALCREDSTRALNFDYESLSRDNLPTSNHGQLSIYISVLIGKVGHGIEAMTIGPRIHRGLGSQCGTAQLRKPGPRRSVRAGEAYVEILRLCN